jgi:V-type H+-transporting ATPase subunit a
MTFAICLQVPNHRYFGKSYSIVAEFLPQILFMECIFGYLIITIIYKWSIDWTTAGTPAPSLLNMLIVRFEAVFLTHSNLTAFVIAVHVPLAWNDR